MPNIHDIKGRQFPAWAMRAHIRKTDDAGEILNEFAYNGEAVRVSPRYQKNGTNFRVRPERPAAFFAAFCYEQGLLPSILTPEECQEAWALELLDPLWEENQFLFQGLESPYAACDHATTPSHRTGFSFVILQILVQQIGAVRSATGKPAVRPAVNGTSAPQDQDAMRRRIEEFRTRAATGSTTGDAASPDKKGKKKVGTGYDPKQLLAAVDEASTPAS